VDNRSEVREFLISRRAKVTPQQAGVPLVGHRRVPGLRRSEVAVSTHKLNLLRSSYLDRHS
jgi:hypothetical protein